METNWGNKDIRLYAVVASLLISIFTFLFPAFPNDDAYTYIRTANIFVDQGLAAAYQHYSWATYSIFIGLISKLGFELFTAAYVLNALLYAGLVFAFISIVKEIDSSRLVMLLASVVILLYPQLNEYRYDIIRDTGFWTLALLALWQLLLYARTGAVKYAVLYCCALLIAATFRSEAIVYLLIAPLAILFDHRFERTQCNRKFWVLETIIAGLALIALLVLTFAGVNILELFIQFVSVYKPFIVSTFSPDPDQAASIGRVLFSEHAASYSQEYIGIFMAAGLFVILLANLFNGIGGPYLWLLVYGVFSKRIGMPRPVAAPVVIYLLINGLVLLSFLFVTRYLTSRYAILFCLMMALFIPQLLASVLQSVSEKNRTALVVFISVFFTYCAVDSFYSFGDSKSYIFDAIEWIEVNDDAGGALLTNNNAIAYYSGRVENYDATMRMLSEAEILQTNPNDLIAIELNYTMQTLLDSPALANILEKVSVFPDTENQRVAIYRRVSP